MKVAVMTETAIIQRLAEGVHGTGWATAGAKGVAGVVVNGTSRGAVQEIRGSRITLICCGAAVTRKSQERKPRELLRR
jgi:regulator of RNase E activity RraA